MAKSSTSKARKSRRIKDIKLHSLLEATKAINNNQSREELLQLYEYILKEELSIGKLVLYAYDNGWECLLSYGIRKSEFDKINVEDFAHLEEISTMDLSKGVASESLEIIIPVFHKSQSLAFVMIGDIEDKMELSPTIKHLPFVQTLTNIIVVAIENKKLYKENIRQATMKKELEFASEMQSMLFPSFLPNNNKLQMAAVYLPHQEVGGDYYDFIQLSEDEVAFCIADVSGKGVAAALLMANFQANLRALFSSTIRLTELIKKLNEKVMNSAKGEKFITLFIARYNKKSKVLQYINAGHNPPIIANKKTIDTLRNGCTGIGMLDELIDVTEGIITIKEETVIVAYTDGVVEIENNNKEEFGTERLESIIKNNFDLTMEDLNAVIVSKVDHFKENCPYVDDIALFSCKIY